MPVSFSNLTRQTSSANVFAVSMREASFMRNISPAVVFAHSAWHDASTWYLVALLLAVRGHVVWALDLPGAGRNAKLPCAHGRQPPRFASIRQRPLTQRAGHPARTHPRRDRFN